MSWLSPEIDHAEIRQRFPEMKSWDCDPAIITNAIDDAESLIRPLARQQWNDDALLAADPAIKVIVRKMACSNVYRSTWGVATFTTTFDDAARALRTEALEDLDLLKKSGLLTNASTGAAIRSNGGASRRIFDMGDEHDWSAPSGKNEPETDPDRGYI